MTIQKFLFAVLCASLAGMPLWAQTSAQNLQKINNLDQALTQALENHPQDSAVPYVNIVLLKKAVLEVLQANPRASYEQLHYELNPVINKYLSYRLDKAPLSEEEMALLKQAFADAQEPGRSIINMVLESFNIRAVAAQSLYENMQDLIKRQKELPYFSDIQAAQNIFSDSMVEMLGPNKMAELLKQLFHERLSRRPFSEDESAYLAWIMNLSEENTKMMESLLNKIRL